MLQMFYNRGIEIAADIMVGGTYILSENVTDTMDVVVSCYFGRKTKVDK